MRLITTILALLLAPSGAWAEWVKVGETNTTEFYLDPSSVQHEKGLRRTLEVQNFKHRRNGGLHSMLIKGEYDCEAKRHRVLALSAHSEPMATGQNLGASDTSSPWETVQPNTPFNGFFKVVCGR